MSGNILIVEDDGDLRDILVETLQGEGFNTIAAADGAEALGLLKFAPIDVVITDVAMPGVSGIELAQEISKRQNRVPSLVFITGGAMTSQEAFSLGADAFITKPLNEPLLIAAVRHFSSVHKRNNVTAKKLAEVSRTQENIARMAELGLLASGIAHEIRGALQAASHLTEELVSETNAQTNKIQSDRASLQKKALDIQQMIKRMEIICTNVSSISRNSAQDPLVSENVSELIGQSVQLLQRKFHLEAITLEILPIPDGLSVSCRASQFIQVIVNLLSNAADAVNSLQSKWVRIEAIQNGPHNGVIIKITDSGHGIPPDVAEKIFSPFFTSKPKDKGTGLGLSLSLKIMEDHDGSICLNSESENTQFIVTFP